MKESQEYKYCNHHHELTDKHEIVDFGTGKFVANKDAIPLLEALHNVGLKTRTHHIDGSGNAFFSIIIEGVQVEIKQVFEKDADRTVFNGKYELLIQWDRS